MATTVFNFGPELDRIDANVKQVLTNLGAIMTVLADLQAADAAIQSAINNAITLIQSLHTGSGGSVSDADVEAVVADLNKAASALSAATPQP